MTPSAPVEDNDVFLDNRSRSKQMKIFVKGTTPRSSKSVKVKVEEPSDDQSEEPSDDESEELADDKSDAAVASEGEAEEGLGEPDNEK